MRTASAILAAAIAATCADRPLEPTAGRLQRTSAHYEFHYSASDAPGIERLANESDARVPAIVAALEAGGLGRVRVHLYPSHADLAAAVRPFVGSIPSWVRGLVTSPQDIHMLSSGASTPQQARDAAILVTHEFVHCVSLRLNPQIGNNPRWLWETAALYYAGQVRDPGSVAAIAAGPPALETLNSFESTLIYDVGNSIGGYITERWGADTLRRLILSTGDTQTVLGLTGQDLITQWHAWARGRHAF